MTGPEPAVGASPEEPSPGTDDGVKSKSFGEWHRPFRVHRILQAAAVALVAALLGLLIWRVVAGNPGSGLVDAIKRSKRPLAPGFTLPVIWTGDRTWPPVVDEAFADGRLSLSELRGQPVVLNFWASWCIPCRKEAPVFAASARVHRSDVVFVGLDVQDMTSDARRFLRRYKVPYASVRESGSRVYRAYGLTGVPETYYIDRRGRIVAHSIGAASGKELEAGIQAALRTGKV